MKTLLIAAALAVVVAGPARADGQLVPPPPSVAKEAPATSAHDLLNHRLLPLAHGNCRAT